MQKPAPLPPTSELWDMYMAGNTHAALGERFGCDRKTVYKRLKRAGYPMEKRTPKSRRESPVPEGHRRCTVCRTPHRLDYYSPKGYLCRPCSARKARDKGTLGRYGLSIETFNALLEAQGGVCSICKEGGSRIRSGRSQRMVVDHCHATNVVRGIVCSRCNCAMGMLRDDPAIVDAVARYLRGDRPPIDLPPVPSVSS